jgi:hypothetical protein
VICHGKEAQRRFLTKALKNAIICHIHLSKGTFGTAFVPAFRANLNFFFLLKLSAVCIFWIVLMC